MHYVMPFWDHAKDTAQNISHPQPAGLLRRSQFAAVAATNAPAYLVPNVVEPNKAFCVEGCERQYCGGA
jgi:hypothetical protein